MRTSNPAFRNDAFAPRDWGGIAADLRDGPTFGSTPAKSAVSSTTMTIRGTVVKTSFLLFLCVGVAVLTAVALKNGALPASMPIVIGSAIGSLVLGLIVGFVPRTAPYLSPVYAVVKGVLVGAISLAVAERAGPKGGALVAQAIMLTFGIFIALLGGYAFGLVRIGGTMTKVIIVATGGVFIAYLAHFVLSMMGIGILGAIHGGGPIGIIFSLVVVVLASLNLVLDFQMIENGVTKRAPKYMEWYGGFALLVTLVWLYLEILKLLAKLNRRN